MIYLPALFSLALLLTTSASWAQSDQLSVSEKQRQNLGILTAPLTASRNGEMAGLPAKVTIPASQIFVISTQMPAMVTQVWAGVGDSVRKGQPLVSLESSAFADTQRSFQQAKVQDQLSGQALAREEALWKEGIISERRILEARARASETRASLAERREALRLSGISEDQIREISRHENISGQLTLRAPTDGVIMEKAAETGQWLNTATVLFKVARLSPLSLEIQAPASMVRNIQVGNLLNVPAYAASGKVSAVGRSLSNNSQSVLVRATIDKGSENLNVGQFVEATIQIQGGNLRQWQIPNQAIARIGGQPTIYVSTASGFRAQPVSILSESQQTSVISGPLKGNENIAVQGVSALKSISMGMGGGE